ILVSVDQGPATEEEQMAGLAARGHVGPGHEIDRGLEHRLVPEVVLADPTYVAHAGSRRRLRRRLRLCGSGPGCYVGGGKAEAVRTLDPDRRRQGREGLPGVQGPVGERLERLADALSRPEGTDQGASANREMGRELVCPLRCQVSKV